MRDQSKIEPKTLGRRIIEGDRLALARGLTRVENRTPEGRELLDFLFHQTGSAVRIGLTGPPGSGKSTLVSWLARKFRERGHQVGILAIDPTSPFTGGAILGDRIRMGDLAGDAGVFIRSMATRGHQGGLSATTYEASEVLEAAGFDRIIIETVGVGQSELEIASAADTTLVILVPESGDAIQVMKAGVMEIGDIFVVNKYDRQGGDHLLKEIHAILDLSPPDRHDFWKPMVLSTTASMGTGVDELMDAIQAHTESREFDETEREKIRRQKIRARMRLLLSGRLLDEAWSQILEVRLNEVLDRVVERSISPYAWIDGMVAEISRRGWQE